MSLTKGSRAGRITIVAICLTILAVNAPPSSPALRDERPEPPDLETIQVLEELAGWVQGEDSLVSLGDDGAGADGALDLAGEVRLRRRSFDLFRGYAATEDRQELLRRFPYGDLLSGAARRHSLDGLLLAAVVQAESGFNPEAVSPQGAVGLMQVMPDTAELFRIYEPSEPRSNVEAGARYLAWLLERFEGDLELALAAYNAGPGNVDRFDGIPPFRETRVYVNRVLGHYVDHHQELWRSSGVGALVF